VDDEPAVPASPAPPLRPRIVGIVGDSVTPEIRIVVASRIGGRLGGFVADRALAGAARQLGEDLRIVEPARMLPLLEDLPVLLIHGEVDDTVPVAAGRRLSGLGGSGTEHWVVPGAGHSGAHATDPVGWETRVEAFLRRAFGTARP
jgi:pimeloyl-ACP methyl ester carboxylesterase